MDELLEKEIKRLGDELWWNYYKAEEDGDAEPEVLNYGIDALRADIEEMMSDKTRDPDTVEKDVRRIIGESFYSKEIIKMLRIYDIRGIANIRRNFGLALKNVKKGTELSSILGWGLSRQDIKELAILHKRNRYRMKIEDLLTDCNFHKECGEFIEGKYEYYLNDNVANN